MRKVSWKKGAAYCAAAILSLSTVACGAEKSNSPKGKGGEDRTKITMSTYLVNDTQREM